MNKKSGVNKKKVKNRIAFYRRRMRLSQRRVAALLDHRDSSTLSTYEHGLAMPPVIMAFRLGIILRVPVEFLFPDLYDSLRMEIREQEERSPMVLRRVHINPSPSPA